MGRGGALCGDRVVEVRMEANGKEEDGERLSEEGLEVYFAGYSGAEVAAAAALGNGRRRRRRKARQAQSAFPGRASG